MRQDLTGKKAKELGKQKKIKVFPERYYISDNEISSLGSSFQIRLWLYAKLLFSVRRKAIWKHSNVFGNKRIYYTIIHKKTIILR